MMTIISRKGKAICYLCGKVVANPVSLDYPSHGSCVAIAFAKKILNPKILLGDLNIKANSTKGMPFDEEVK